MGLLVALGQLWICGMCVWAIHEWWLKQQQLPACELTYMYPSFQLQQHELLGQGGSSGYQLFLFRELTIPYSMCVGRHRLCVRVRVSVRVCARARVRERERVSILDYSIFLMQHWRS